VPSVRKQPNQGMPEGPYRRRHKAGTQTAPSAASGERRDCWQVSATRAGTHRLYMIFLSLYSRKLHCFCCLASTTALTSRTVRALSLEGIAEYHLVSRTLPCRLISRTK